MRLESMLLGEFNREPRKVKHRDGKLYSSIHSIDYETYKQRKPDLLIHRLADRTLWVMSGKSLEMLDAQECKYGKCYVLRVEYMTGSLIK
jgi:hypothetical protein